MSNKQLWAAAFAVAFAAYGVIAFVTDMVTAIGAF